MQPCMSEKSITIIGRASSINVRKVLWTCREIGLSFTFDSNWEADARVARRAALLALNPNDQFPVLLDREGPIWESNTICRYLAAEHRRTDLLPTIPRERAAVEQWMDWQATDLNSAWRYAFMSLIRRAPQYNSQSELKASVAAWNAAMTLLEQQLAFTGEYVTGPVFTLADVVLGASVNRWILTPAPKPELPAVTAYYDRLGSRPGFVEYVRTGTP